MDNFDGPSLDQIDSEPLNFIDTQQHLKIWFSSNPDLFINIENELRIVRFLEHNPFPAQLSLVYSSFLLGDKGREELERFRRQYPSIHLIDFDSDLKNECLTENDRQIYEFARQEILYSRQLDRSENPELDPASIGGGNLAAASDLVRVLTPIAEKGTYSDFDTTVKTKKLPQYVMVKKGFVGNIEWHLSVPVINNDLCAYAKDENGLLSEDAQKFLKNIQEVMIFAYTHPVSHALKKPSVLQMMLSGGPIPEIYRDNLSVIQLRRILLPLDSLYRRARTGFPLPLLKDLSLSQIADISPTLTHIKPETIEKLKRDFSDLNLHDFSSDISEEEKDLVFKILLEIYAYAINNVLCHQIQQFKQMLPFAFGFDKENIEKQIAGFEATLAKNERIQTLYATDQKQAALDLFLAPDVVSGSDDINQDFIIKKDAVSIFSGPHILKEALENFQGLKIPACHYPSFGFADYSSLKDAYQSNNSFSGIVGKRQPAAQVGAVCDVSWTEEGQLRQRERESLYKESAQKIQKCYRKKQENRNARLP